MFYKIEFRRIESICKYKEVQRGWSKRGKPLKRGLKLCTMDSARKMFYKCTEGTCPIIRTCSVIRTEVSK